MVEDLLFKFYIRPFFLKKKKLCGQLSANDVCLTWTAAPILAPDPKAMTKTFKTEIFSGTGIECLLLFSSCRCWKRVCEIWNVKELLSVSPCGMNYVNRATSVWVVLLDYISSWKELNTALQTENAKFKSWKSWFSVWSVNCCVLDSEVTGQEHMAYVSWRVGEGQECMLNTLRCG